MTQLRFWLHWQRFCTWLNQPNVALNLTGAWGIVALAALILAIEFGA
jgi:hypothetical protein